MLAGDVNPSGHLPVTFPTSMAKSAVPTRSQWPGIGLTSTYSEGLQVGYRFNHATGTKPLFPFGFGLSYTTFSYRHVTVIHQGGGYAVSVEVTNTGRRVGHRRGPGLPHVPEVGRRAARAAGRVRHR